MLCSVPILRLLLQKYHCSGEKKKNILKRDQLAINGILMSMSTVSLYEVAGLFLPVLCFSTAVEAPGRLGSTSY